MSLYLAFIVVLYLSFAYVRTCIQGEEGGGWFCNIQRHLELIVRYALLTLV